MCLKPTPFLIFLIFLLLSERIKSRIPINGFKEMILNGDFKENNPLNRGSYGTNSVPHWSITHNYFEVLYGKTYNSNWDDNKYVIDIDSLSNSVASQQFTIDSNYTCQLKMAYSSSKYANNRDGFNIIFNNIEKFRVDPIPNDNINYVNIIITTKLGLNLLELGALGVSNAYGALLTDISIQCPIFKNYIFFISEGDYELYKDGSLFSSGQALY